MVATQQKLITVLGPTATGKSDLAVEIALRYDGEVVSADSRQVYTGLNIGTGKITTEEMRGVSHHLLDVADPKKRYTVAMFRADALHAIEGIFSRGKLPILCGGTGFYIQAVVDGVILPEVPPNEPLRKELAAFSPEELFARLSALDPTRAKTIDPANPRRLIRAIEIAHALGNVPQMSVQEPPFHTFMIGLDLDDETLRSRIAARLEKRLAQGMLEEAERLHARGLSYARMEELGLEYRYMARHLRGELSREEMVRELESKIWHYARRQHTWFRRDQRIRWFHPEEKERVFEIAEKFLEKNKV